MLSSGMICYYLELMVSLSSGTKCYHLGWNVIIWSQCYHLGTTFYHLGWNVIIWDAMLSSGANVIIWDKMRSSGAYVIMVSSGANVIIWCYHVILSSGMITHPFFIFPENFTHSFKLNHFFLRAHISTTVRVSGILQYKQFIDPNNTVKNHGHFKIHLSVLHPHSLDNKKCLKNSTGPVTKGPAFNHFQKTRPYTVR